MDDRRIAHALADMDHADAAAERSRRRRARWRIFVRVIAIICLLAGGALLALLLRPLPTQAELQYTQGHIRQARLANAMRSRRFVHYVRFEITLEDDLRSFTIDSDAADRNARTIADIARPGATARIGYTTGGTRAWDLAIDDKQIYSLSDIRAHAEAESRPFWFLSIALLVAGIVGWVLTPRPRHHGHRYNP